VVLLAILLGLRLPITPVQILWVNLVTDGLPALALGMEPVDPAIMQRPPRDPAEPVVNARRGAIMILQGSFIALCALAAYLFVLFVEQAGEMRARTAAFVVLSCAQLVHAFNCRSETRSLFALGVCSNVKLVYAVLISLALQITVVTVPFLERIFRVETLSAKDWVVVMALSSFPLWAMEIVKFVRQRSTDAQPAPGSEAPHAA
jgi:P-type Ca2+ transporter type 2C